MVEDKPEMRTGEAILKAATSARCRKASGTNLARSIGVPGQLLDSWVRGDAHLSEPQLAALAGELFHGHARFDAEHNVMRPSAKLEPAPWGTVRAPPAVGTPPDVSVTGARPRLPVPPGMPSQQWRKPPKGWAA